MSTTILFIVIVCFFCMLLGVSYFTSKNVNNETFFTGNRQSRWYLVAFAMIGTTISGVTFISVPGEVGNSGWTYLQFLLGNFVGYWAIALVLIPLYYKLNLVSIYTYLDQRFGVRSYKTGSFFFLVSRTIGASFRMYLVAGVLQLAFFDALGIPFAVTVAIAIFMIWVYTYRAGIKTVIWTDSLQTTFLLASVILTIIIISTQLDMNFGKMITAIDQHPYSRIFDWDWRSKTNFFKQFLAGLGIVIVMNGLDQDMMQKSLTCKNKKDAQKNIFWFSLAFILTNILFLSLGVMLYIFAQVKGIPVTAKSDDFFAFLALNQFGTIAGVLFLLGIVSATYSSSDSALTALTTSFCIDFLNLDPKNPGSKPARMKVHVAFSIYIIVLRTRTDALGRAVAEVTDDGPGMPPDMLHRIFDPFFTTPLENASLGLGLAVCHSIVTSLGGEIDVESELGSGTTFRVTLPAATAPTAAPTGPAPRAPALQPAKKPATAAARARILVIDDEIAIGNAIRRILGADHDVTVESDARSALERIDRETYDVVFCDLMMPNMSGMDFFEQLSQRAPELAERLVFLTGGAFSPRSEEFLRSNHNRCIAKPFSRETLCSIVSRMRAVGRS